MAAEHSKATKIKRAAIRSAGPRGGCGNRRQVRPVRVEVASSEIPPCWGLPPPRSHPAPSAPPGLKGSGKDLKYL